MYFPLTKVLKDVLLKRLTALVVANWKSFQGLAMQVNDVSVVKS